MKYETYLLKIHPSKKRRLKELSQKTGIPMSMLVRWAIDHYLPMVENGLEPGPPANQSNHRRHTKR